MTSMTLAYGDGGSNESDEKSSIHDTRPDNEMPATAARVLLNVLCMGVEEDLASMVCRFSSKRHTEIEGRQAQQKGLGAARRAQRRQQRHPEPSCRSTV